MPSLIYKPQMIIGGNDANSPSGGLARPEVKPFGDDRPWRSYSQRQSVDRGYFGRSYRRLLSAVWNLTNPRAVRSAVI